MANPAQQPNQIQMHDNMPGGEYANWMQVSHDREEFFLHFANVVPPSGRIVGKVIITPGHLKRIIKALQENLARYESSFGKVEEAVGPQAEVGFRSDK